MIFPVIKVFFVIFNNDTIPLKTKSINKKNAVFKNITIELTVNYLNHWQ